MGRNQLRIVGARKYSRLLAPLRLMLAARNLEGKMRIRLGVLGLAFFIVGTADASAFSMNFRWCGSGSPVFSMSGVPKGTTTLQFHMVDLDVPSYNHGGGSVPYKAQASVPCGALNNYSPP